MDRRNELLETLKILSDRNYQRQAWIDGMFPPSIEYDDPNVAIQFLYDDTDIADDPDSTVGFLLKNQEELNAMKELVRKFDLALKQHDIGYTNATRFIDSPEWLGVVEAANKALVAFDETWNPQ